MKIHPTFFSFCLSSCLFIASCHHSAEKEVVHPVSVKVIALRSGAVGNGIAYDGTIMASQTVDLSFQVSGTLLRIPVETGEYVKMGQLIAEVDETTYRNQYNAQLAQAKLAKENYTRVAEVFRKGSIAEIKMLEAKSSYDQATAAANAVYQNIKHCRIYAPASGYIGSKRMEAGATAGPGVPVVQLLNIAEVDITFPVPEAEINKYKKGDKATISVAALNDKTIQGQVEEVGLLSVQGSASYMLKVRVKNGDRVLKPGMLCKVSFDKSSPSTAKELMIPANAVQVDEKGENFVYIVAGDHAERRNIETGGLYNNDIVVKSGLTGNDQLIISGYHKLNDNALIQISK